MPAERHQQPEPEYGHKQPERIPEGRLSVKQALDMLNQHNADPELHTTQSLAKEYKLQLVNAQNILKHFHVLLLQMPLDSKGKPYGLALDTGHEAQTLKPVGRNEHQALPDTTKHS